MYGRKKILIGSAFLLVLTVWIVPWTSPSLLAFNVVYTFGFALRCLKETNPLILDYVKSESRGRAVGMKLFGVLAGEIFTQAVLVGLTSKMTFKNSFHVVSIYLLIMVIPMFWMVKDTKKVV